MPPKQPTLLRRSLLLAGLGHIAGVQALTPRQLVFPRDFGAHPDLRTEWWYITGHASVSDRLFGFQLTFFRSRVDATQGMVSRLAARQLIDPPQDQQPAAGRHGQCRCFACGRAG